jgi:hypothetical protein
MRLDNFFGPAIPALTGDNTNVWNDAPFRCSYELRYTGDSTRASWVGDGFYGTDYVYWVPLECWNITTNERVSLAVYDYENNDIWDVYDDLAVVDYPYDPEATVTPFAFPYHYSWLFNFEEDGFSPAVGDVFTVAGAPLNGPDDQFAFKVDGISANAAANQLKDIKVVPNPYFGHYDARVETSEGESVIKFTKVPGQCTIRIYTLAGDLVKTIEHNTGEGEVSWNLQSSNQQQVASGTYLFHVDSEYGEHLGRFAVIK